MVAEHKIDRQKLISGHNPVLTEIATDSPLTVGNGELAFTADITGMQTLYEEYQELPLCTMSQWGWHTKPVSREKYNYTLDDLVMTEYVNREGRLLKYPQDKKVGNEDVYNWLRENPHRLNLVRVRLQWEEESISAEDITGVRQELVLYEGILYSEFQIRNNACRVRTACHNEGRDILAFSLESEALKEKKISIVLDFPYGASDITASDWTQNDRHRTTILQTSDEKMLLWRQLDRDEYYAGIYAQGGKIRKEGSHTLRIFANGEKLDISIALGKQKEQAECLSAQEVAPLVGAWIEILNQGVQGSSPWRRSPRGSVD